MTTVIANNQSKPAISELAGTLRAQSKPAGGAGSALVNLGRSAAPAELSQQAKVEKQVRNWVGESFFGTMLKQMRDSPFKSELFEGGKGGAAYGQLFDQRMAQHMAGGVGSKIVRPMVKAMLNRKNASNVYRQQSNVNQEAANGSTDRRA